MRILTVKAYLVTGRVRPAVYPSLLLRREFSPIALNNYHIPIDSRNQIPKGKCGKLVPAVALNGFHLRNAKQITLFPTRKLPNGGRRVDDHASNVYRRAGSRFPSVFTFFDIAPAPPARRRLAPRKHDVDRKS